VQRLKKAPDDAAGKREALRALMREINVRNAIIFCNRKKDVGIVHRSLKRHGFNVGALHGDMDQHQRTATLDAFRNGTITFLAASDVAARGLDIPDVSHIFNYDVPIHPEDYVHRIGRTGRAGREGFAATLVTPKEVKAIKAIERLLRQDIPWIDGEPSPAEIAHAREDRGRSNGRNRRGSRSSRSRGGGAQASPQARPETQRKEHRASPAYKASKPHQPPQPQQQYQQRREQHPPAAHAKPAQSSAPKAAHTHSHPSPAPQPQSHTGHRPPPKPQQPSRGGVRGMGEHVPAFMTRSVRPLD
jgi:superfamily II DNA/RNA helicase